MGELESTFPTEVWIHIVSQTCLDTPNLASISLVSRMMREVAQRELFRNVVFHYQSALTISRHSLEKSEINVNLEPYTKKVLGICRLPRLCSFIKHLKVDFCNNAPWDLPHTKFTDTIFCEMMDRVAIALPTMFILRRLSYNAPFLLGNMHRAILCHPQLKSLSITPLTSCERPCREATMKRGVHQPLQALEIVDWSPVQAIHGLGSPTVGARRCALTSNILLTHSLSLRKLRVPVLLLYDALASSSMKPELPHLSSLSITPLLPLTLAPLGRLCPGIADQLTQFLLCVHETIQHLDWRSSSEFDPFETLPPSCFPNLETLEGDRVECLLGNSSLRRLRLIAYPGPAIRATKEAEKQSIQALRHCQMSSPQLKTLFIQRFIISWEFAPVIAAFSALEELSCTLRIGMGPVGTCGFTPLTGLIDLVERLFGQCIPQLYHLHTLSIQACDTGFNEPAPLESIINLASSLQSESLERFNFRLVLNEPETLPWATEVYESMELHRIYNKEGQGSQWIAPQGKVIITADQHHHTHCEAHDKCSLNELLEPESWIEI